MEDPSIIRLNIERFSKLLRGPLDSDTRRIVEQLLAEARAALRSVDGDDPVGRIEPF